MRFFCAIKHGKPTLAIVFSNLLFYPVGGKARIDDPIAAVVDANGGTRIRNDIIFPFPKGLPIHHRARQLAQANNRFMKIAKIHK